MYFLSLLPKLPSLRSPSRSQYLERVLLGVKPRIPDINVKFAFRLSTRTSFSSLFIPASGVPSLSSPRVVSALVALDGGLYLFAHPTSVVTSYPNVPPLVPSEFLAPVSLSALTFQPSPFCSTPDLPLFRFPRPSDRPKQQTKCREEKQRADLRRNRGDLRPASEKAI